MPLGKPSIATPRALELRVIAQAVENIRQRIEAIEAQTTNTAAQAGETTLRAGQQNISITALRTQLVALVARVDALAATDTELETFRAGSAIAVNTAVYPSGDGVVSQVDPSDPLKVYAVLGVATQTVVEGASVVVRKAGVMQILDAVFEPGGPVYVGVAGLTQFPDYINLAIPVGVATDTDEIDVRPGWPALQYPGVYSDYETFLPPTWGLVRDAVTLAQDFNSAGNGIVVRIGPDNVTTRTIEAGGNLVVEDGDGVADNPFIRDTPISELPIRSGGLNGHEAVAVDAGDGTSYQVSVQDIADLAGSGSGSVTSVGITGADFAITGSPITSSGDIGLTLTTVNSNVGSFGSSTAIPNFTVNAKGLTTAAGTNAVVAPAGTLTGTTLAANVVTSSLTSVGTIGTGAWQGSAIAAGFGGTGFSSYSDGDLLVGLNGAVIAKLGVGSENQVLKVTSGLPAWGGAPSSALNSTQIGYGNGSNVLTGTSTFTWTNSTLTMQMGAGTGPSTLRTANASSGANAASLTIQTGDANSGVVGAGLLTLQGGAGAGSSAAGSIAIIAGNNPSTGAGGSVSITAGTSSGGTAGNVTVVTNGTTRITVANTGAVTFQAGITGTSGTFSSTLQSTSLLVTGGTAPANGMYLQAAGVVGLSANSTAAYKYGSNAFLAQDNNTRDLGETGTGNWRNIYSQNAVTVASDRRNKTEVEISALGLDFVRALRPVSYRQIVGSNAVEVLDDEARTHVVTPVPGKRRHYGFIAQEVQQELAARGMDGASFAGWCIADTNDPESPQALRYEQFIPILWRAVQELTAEVRGAT